MSSYTKKFENPIIYNPVDHVIYMDDMGKLDDSYSYRNPIMNAKSYSLAASAKQDDPLRVTENFYNNGKEETNFSDIANDYYSKAIKAKETGDRSLAAAIITSKEYTLLQDTVLLGTNEETIRTGILGSLFQEISTPTLTGKYRAFTNDLVYFTNLAESKSPEPTFGAATETTISVPKHGGAVAITDRARQVIAGADAIYSDLISKLQLKRALSESIIVRTAIEGIAATNDQSGVDFGARTSMLSTTNPVDLWTTIINFFEGKQRDFNSILSKAFIYNEYINNDIIRGNGTPLTNQGSFNESSGPTPALNGVTWYRDNLMSSSTNMFVFDRNAAGKNFRGPTRAYTVTDPDTETTKYVTKSHFDCVIVDGTAIARVTAVAA